MSPTRQGKKRQQKRFDKEFKLSAVKMMPLTSSITLAGNDWEAGTEFEPAQGYEKAEKRSYYLTVKPCGHNAHMDRTEEFYTVLLETLGEVKQNLQNNTSLKSDLNTNGIF